MTAFDSIECARLAAEMREDDARMTPAPWVQRVTWDAYGRIDGPQWPVAHVLHDDDERHAIDEDTAAYADGDISGIARLSNNALAAAEQLEAAVAEIERLTRERDEVLGEGVLSQRVCDIENDRAQLRADVDRMRPVVESADAWRTADLACARDAKSVDVQRAEYALAQAVDAYREVKP